MDFDKAIEELRKAWDALEEMGVKGYQARVRVTLAQESILSVYSALTKARREAEKEEAPEGIPGEE